MVLVWPCRRFPGLYCVVFVFQLSCCGKGTGTNLFTQLTDKFGATNICPSNTFTVSTIIYLSGLIFARMLLAHGEKKQDHHLALCRNHEVSQNSSINFAVRHFLSAVYLHQANTGVQGAGSFMFASCLTIRNTSLSSRLGALIALAGSPVLL